jgi:hypothetical protein
VSSETPERDVAYCPHCGNDSQQQLIASHFHRATPNGRSYYTVVFCETCRGPLLYQHEAGAPGGWFSLEGLTLVWPQAATLHHSVPPRIRDVYREAAGIKQRSPNGFAGQIRRCLEALCRDRKADGRNLSDRLLQLADKGEIPTVLTEMTDVLRLLGNMGSHDDDVSVGPEYVDVIDDFFRAVVEYVYVAPYRVNEVRKQLESARSAAREDA